MNQEKELKRTLAEESAKTRKAREKLKKQLEDFEKKMTPEALGKKTIEIHQWIARNTQDRVVIKNKFSLFDKNQNTAKLSARVSSLAELLTNKS